MDLQIRPEIMEIETTWGVIKVDVFDGKVAGCTLPFLADQPEQPFRIIRAGNDSVSTFVAAAFSGKKIASPPLAELKGTDFQNLVWREIARILPGQTKTYGELAAAIGRPKAVRAVGSACGRNPVQLFIPCHRVKGTNGQLGGFSCGRPWKRLLLDAEDAT